MPSEHTPSRPSLGGHRSTNSLQIDSPSASTSPATHHKQKGSKHVVSSGRTHTRVPSSKGLHKLTKVHGNEGSHTDLKKLGKNSSSTTNLKKNSSHVSLKRNRSSADVSKRPKSSHGQTKRPASVHFEVGGDKEDVDWEEASSSASPALSRSAISSHHSSAKPSANNSRPQSPVYFPPSNNRDSTADVSTERPTVQHTVDGKIIAERLLQRTPSQTTTTKMSLATATPMGRSPDSVDKSQGSTTVNSTPKIGSKEDLVSRFVGSGTPSENSPFLNQGKAEPTESKHEEVKRARSMGNLTRQDSNIDYEGEEESALAPRSRKSSTSHAYIPPQQSRTQQKLWLQRASSNIEPQQITPGSAINRLSGIHGGLGGSSLVGAGYDGRDPRIKIQLERTGLEYLVVRRHQDPVGKALKRLEKLPGMENTRRIPPHSAKKGDGAGVGPSRLGLSQSLKESRNRGKDKATTANGARSDYEGQSGSQDDSGMANRAREDDGVGALLRSIWEKSLDLSASAD